MNAKVAPKPDHHSQAPQLHYDKEALLAEYRSTFSMFIRALMVAVGGAIIVFFVFIVYLGGIGHTPPKPFVDEFGGRIEYEYKGTKLPMFGGPDKPEPAHHGAEEHPAPAGEAAPAQAPAHHE
jgi:hypothetical protein